MAFSEIAIAQHTTPYQKFQAMLTAWDRRLFIKEGMSLRDAFSAMKDLGGRKLRVTVITLNRREIPYEYKAWLQGVADRWKRANGKWPVTVVFVDERDRRLCDYYTRAKQVRCQR